MGENLTKAWSQSIDESRMEKIEKDLEIIKNAILGNKVVYLEGTRKIEDYLEG